MSWLGQVRHVLAKDLRRFWPMLLGWGVLLGVWVWTASPSGVSWDRASPPDLITTVAPFIIAFFAGMVVLEDHPVSDRAFWFTRSISPLAVLTAKALFLGTFLVLLPVFVHAGIAMWWYASEFPSALVLNDLLRHGAFVLLMAWAASLARSLAGFAGLAFAGYLALKYVPLPLVAQGPGYGPMVEYLTWVGWGAVGLVGVALHVGTRVRWAAVAVGVAGLWGLEAGLSHIPAPDRQQVPVPDEVLWTDADSFSVAISEIFHRRVGDSSQVTASLDVRTASGMHPRVRTARAALVSAGPPSFADARPTSWSGPRDLITGAHLDYRPLHPTDWSRQAGVSLEVLSGPTDPVIEEIEGAEGLVMHLVIDLYRPAAVASLPLREGAREPVGGGRARLRGVERSPQRTEVSVSVTGLQRELWNPGSAWMGGSPGFGFVNHATGETLRPGWDSGRTSRAIQGMLGGSYLEVEERTFQAGIPPWDSMPDPSWFDSAELEVLDLEYAGTVERTVQRTISEWPAPGLRLDLDSGDSP